MADERLNPNWGNELKAATNAAGEVVGVLKPQSDSARAPIVVVTTDAVTEITAGGSGALMGTLVSGEWFPVGSIFRLLMTGTGIVTLDSKDALGTITTGVFSETLSGATNQIGFPYVGDAAVQIRATLTGTATAKVI